MHIKQLDPTVIFVSGLVVGALIVFAKWGDAGVLRRKLKLGW